MKINFFNSGYIGNMKYKDTDNSRFNMLKLLPLLMLLLVVSCAQKKPATPEMPEPQAGQNIAPSEQDQTVKAEIPLPDPEPELVTNDEQVVASQEDTTPLTPQEQQALEAKTEIDFDLDLKETKEFKKYFKYYTHTHRKTFQRWLKRAEPFLPYVRKVFKERGLPEDLVLLPFAESGYNAWAYSRAGAAGMWQFMPFTGRKYGLPVDWWMDARRDPYKSTIAAADYLKVLYDMFGDWYLALAAYNAGEGKIARALKKSGTDDFFELSKKNHKLSYRVRLRSETKNYVPKFLAICKIFQNLEALGFEPVSWDKELELKQFEVPGGVDLLSFAKASGLSWNEFKRLNPAFRRTISPPKVKSVAYVPMQSVAGAEKFLANPKIGKYSGFQAYRVRSGDSWWNISRKFGIPISELKKLNNRYSNLLKPGQRLLIPAPGFKSNRTSTYAKTKYLNKNSSTYTVQKGDNLWDISQAFNVSVNTIKRANGLRSSRLKIGQKLHIPDLSPKQAKQSTAQAAQLKKKVVASTKTSVYTVRRGDTLWDISRRYGVSVNTLMRSNGLRTKKLSIGQKLRIPSNSSATEDVTAQATKQHYVVKKGDTVWSISRKMGISPYDIMKWNRLTKRSKIYPGDSLELYIQ